MRRFVRDNALWLTMFGLFLVLWAAQSVSGWHAANADNREHHQPAVSYPSYLTTGHFVEATAENWESEFLQMSGYVFLTAFLRQRARRSPSRSRMMRPMRISARRATGGRRLAGTLGAVWS